jgi:hypothetical protein
MSRFIDKLKHLCQVGPQPMGFMVSKASSEKPKMQLVACLATENLDKVSDGLNSADAALIVIAKSDDIGTLEKVCQLKDGVPGGGWLKASNGGTLKKVLNATCDFVVFPSSAPLTVTQKDKLGRVLELDASLNEGLLRTANDLPVDAILVSGKEAEISLTLNRLMLIQRLVYLVNKPILVSIPNSLTGVELQALWDMGISGVVVDVVDEKSAEKLVELRKAVEKLNPAAFCKKARLSAILPRLQPEAEKPAEEEEGDEEDE